MQVISFEIGVMLPKMSFEILVEFQHIDGESHKFCELDWVISWFWVKNSKSQIDCLCAVELLLFSRENIKGVKIRLCIGTGEL